MSATEDRNDAPGAAVRVQLITARHEELVSRLNARHESAMLLTELLPIDRAKAEATFARLRANDEKRRTTKGSAGTPVTRESNSGRGAPYELVWQTDIPPGGSFYGPDVPTGLVGSNIGVDMGRSAAMGNCVGFRFYSPSSSRIRFRSRVGQIRGWALASGVLGSAQVEGSCTIQIQEEAGGADIGNSRDYFHFGAAGPFIRDEDWFSDLMANPSVDVTTKRETWYQVWSAMDAVVSTSGAAYAGIDCQGYVEQITWEYL